MTTPRIRAQRLRVQRGEKKRQTPRRRKSGGLSKIHQCFVVASVPLRKAPDDHEEGDDPGEAVAADLIDEPDEVLRDRREVPTLVWAEDDVDHNAKCDQHQREIYNVLRPVFDLLNRVHISFFSRQVINAHPPKGVGVLVQHPCGPINTEYEYLPSSYRTD